MAVPPAFPRPIADDAATANQCARRRNDDPRQQRRVDMDDEGQAGWRLFRDNVKSTVCAGSKPPMSICQCGMGAYSRPADQACTFRQDRTRATILLRLRRRWTPEVDPRWILGSNERCAKCQSSDAISAGPADDARGDASGAAEIAESDPFGEDDQWLKAPVLQWIRCRRHVGLTEAGKSDGLSALVTALPVGRVRFGYRRSRVSNPAAETGVVGDMHAARIYQPPKDAMQSGRAGRTNGH